MVKQNILTIGSRAYPVAAKPAWRWQRGLADLNILILLGVIFMVPVAITTWFLIQKQRDEISFAERELAGAQYTGALRTLMQSSGKYRAAARDGSARPAAEVKSGIAAVDAAQTQAGALLGSAAGWGRAKAAWARVESGGDKLEGDQARDALGAWDAALAGHLSDMAGRSNLLQDPQAETSNLARLMTFDVPPLAAAVVDLRSAGASLIADRAGAEARAQAEARRVQLLDRANALKATLDTLFESQAEVRNALQAQSASALKSSVDLVAMVRGDPLPGAADWQTAANKTLAAVDGLSGVISSEHRKRIDARLSTL